VTVKVHQLTAPSQLSLPHETKRTADNKKERRRRKKN